MRTITSLIISCLIIAAGCDKHTKSESPQTERESPQTEREPTPTKPESAEPEASQIEPESPYDAARRERAKGRNWAATLIADATAVLQPLIDEANEELNALDRVIYVDEREFERVVFFLERADGRCPEDSLGGDIDYVDGRWVALVAPTETIRAEWSDRFALAQVFSCQAEIVGAELTKIDFTSPEPFEVGFEVKVTGRRRHAIAGKPSPVPQPPGSYTYWRPMHGGGGIFRRPIPFHMRLPKMPGAPHHAGQTELGYEAVKMLADVTPSMVGYTGTAILRYSTEEDKWAIAASEDTVAIDISAESLSWYHGIDEEYRGCVYAPR